MTTRPTLPLVQPTARMWQILRVCYRGQNPVEVLARALDLLAAAAGHLDTGGRIKNGRHL